MSIDVTRLNGNRVQVRVVDDGIGFDPATAPDGFGLTGMTERLSLVHGTLSVSSAPGAGTTLTAELPTDPGVVRA